MTDHEFEVLDELYFVTSYEDLRSSSEIPDDILKQTLVSLVKKGWVRIYSNMYEESEIEPIDFKTNPTKYHYLASKKGLMKHNSR